MPTYVEARESPLDTRRLLTAAQILLNSALAFGHTKAHEARHRKRRQSSSRRFSDPRGSTLGLSFMTSRLTLASLANRYKSRYKASIGDVDLPCGINGLVRLTGSPLDRTIRRSARACRLPLWRAGRGRPISCTATLCSRSLGSADAPPRGRNLC